MKLKRTWLILVMPLMLANSAFADDPKQKKLDADTSKYADAVKGLYDSKGYMKKVASVRTLCQQGKYEQALKQSKNMEDDSPGLFFEGLSLAGLKRQAEAKAAWEKGSNIEPKGSLIATKGASLFYRGHCYHMLGAANNKSSQDYWNKAIQAGYEPSW